MGKISTSLPSPSRSRITYIDLLRILAIYTTVVIHVITQVWNAADVHGFSWKVYNFFLSGSCWGVPVFVMISGALFLDPDRTLHIKKLYSKNIGRLVLAFCFWAVAYALVFDLRKYSPEQFIHSIFTGEFHMWYVVMILVLYMLTPLLRRFTDDKSLTCYFLKLSLLISFVIPQALFLLEMLPVPYFKNAVQGLIVTFANLKTYFPHYFLFYFVAGHYLTHRELSPLQRRILYVLGLLGFVGTVVGTNAYSVFLNRENQYFHGKDTVNVLFMAVAVFVFARYELSRISFTETSLKHLRTVSDCCMGIYFVHLMISNGANGVFDLYLWPIHPIVRCIALPMTFFLCSLVTVLVMRRIPLLKKVV